MTNTKKTDIISVHKVNLKKKKQMNGFFEYNFRSCTTYFYKYLLMVINYNKTNLQKE